MMKNTPIGSKKHRESAEPDRKPVRTKLAALW